MNDERIVDLYFARSEKAIEETAAKYGRYCFSIAYGVLYSNEDAEESVNDTYMAAWQAMPPHRPGVLSVFLGKITRRISIDRWRRTHAEKRGGGEMPVALEELAECLASGEDVMAEMDRERLGAVLAAFVRSLPLTEKKVFVCRYWYMESVASVSKRFGFSESKIKSMLYRTREKLRVQLEKEGLA